MFTAEDMMNVDVLSVREDTPVRDAIELMLNYRITGLPVVDKDMKLVGIITDRDVVGLIYDTECLETKSVGSFMAIRPMYFDIDDDLVDICDYFTKNVFRSVPITADGKLVGIISVQDVLQYAVKLCDEKE